MTGPDRERRATECAARHAQAVEGLDRCAELLREQIARNNARLQPGVTVADLIERHPEPANDEPWLSPWAETLANWALAFALGFGLAWLAASGF